MFLIRPLNPFRRDDSMGEDKTENYRKRNGSPFWINMRAMMIPSWRPPAKATKPTTKAYLY